MLGHAVSHTGILGIVAHAYHLVAVHDAELHDPVPPQVHVSTDHGAGKSGLIEGDIHEEQKLFDE